MSLRSFISKQFIDVIDWVEPGDGILAYRYPMQDREIQNGGQLTVRDSQLALFVNEGQIADQFTPGLHTLNTQTLPILTYLRNWDKAFKSPFKSDVYFFSTRQQVNQKWGTATPITIRDREFGAVRMRAYGIYSYHIGDPKAFHQKVSGTREAYRVSDLQGQFPRYGRQPGASRFGDAREPDTGIRQPWPGSRQLRGGEHLSTRGIAETPRPAHRHEHDRRYEPVYAIPGRPIHADRRS